jgi:pimeloyl-ACP methyl ester carboxylesterase
VLGQDAEGFARNCLALADAQGARTELIGCPVLVVNGDEDAVTPLSAARQLAERLRDARVEVLGRCGHWPMLERPIESQRALRAFLERQR